MMIKYGIFHSMAFIQYEQLMVISWKVCLPTKSKLEWNLEEALDVDSASQGEAFLMENFKGLSPIKTSPLI